MSDSQEVKRDRGTGIRGLGGSEIICLVRQSHPVLWFSMGSTWQYAVIWLMPH